MRRCCSIRVVIDTAAVADHIDRQLKELGTPERAQNEKAYLKSELEHHGASVWEIRRVVKALTAQPPGISGRDLITIVTLLWSKPVHERRMAAVILLDLRSAVLGPDDLPLVERLIRESHTWAYVDGLAGDVAGSIMVRHPHSMEVLDRWATDADFWIRRSALLAMIEPLKHGTAFDRFASYADSMLEEKEFFIRKAIGWVLREVGKERSDEVYGWLLPRAGRASGVTVREAVKYLERGQRDAILRARA